MKTLSIGLLVLGGLLAAVQPGAIAADPARNAIVFDDARLYEVTLIGLPKEEALRRLGTPDEFGSICAFLCSQHASYITGQNILADGGAYPGTH